MGEAKQPFNLIKSLRLELERDPEATAQKLAPVLADLTQLVQTFDPIMWALRVANETAEEAGAREDFNEEIRQLLADSLKNLQRHFAEIPQEVKWHAVQIAMEALFIGRGGIASPEELKKLRTKFGREKRTGIKGKRLKILEDLLKEKPELVGDRDKLLREANIRFDVKLKALKAKKRIIGATTLKRYLVILSECPTV
jgi:hypothetical protein